ncbi:hypothetical protein [Streptomyces sp. NPDC004658]|uniref:hypothetical protein n=1 Tax=Streptomyces sp. NPDC004658 TaxID=3154672 RepID=UPI0033B1F147
MYLQPRPGIAWPSPRLRELNNAVRALLDLDDDTAVVIRQLIRGQAGRSRPETVVAVLPMEGEPRRWVLHRSAEQITEHELRAALLGHGPRRPAPVCPEDREHRAVKGDGWRRR